MASRSTQQSPAFGEAWWREDHLWATTAPTPEARGVKEICRNDSGETSIVGTPVLRRSRISLRAMGTMRSFSL
jgi:hypothetical protein